ncbi:MAG: hypothetical protein PHS84_10725, partial [Paludibacter sp.]|nr:hypothetical protein [Paludibacter sp.]
MNSKKFIVYSLKFIVNSLTFNLFSIGRYFTILLFLLPGNVIQAQDSLSVYLEMAGKNNPGLQAKYLEYSAALEKVPQVGALPDPTAQLGFFLNPMELLGGNQVGNMQL